VSKYLPRIVDTELDELIGGAPAIALEGPKGIGKTASLLRRANTAYAIDDPRQRVLLEADPERLSEDAPPILLDEWQRLPAIWDWVRRAVDRGAQPGRFLMAGSAVPKEAPVHSGAGRIVTLRMRPLSLAERNLEEPTISLARLLAGEKPELRQQSRLKLRDYVEEIVASGFPAIRSSPPKVRRSLLDGYVQRIAQRDFEDQGRMVRKPEILLAWMRAYSAATATSASYNRILDAATPGEAEKPSRKATEAYRQILSDLWLLEPLPAWFPDRKTLSRLGQGPKHQLADPALAVRLLGLGPDALLSGEESGPEAFRDGDLLGRLFESLVTLSLRVYAQPNEASVHHLRTRNGDHEVDLIVERDDGRALAIEVKLSPVVSDEDVRHLHWLRERMGGDLIDALVVTTGQHAYRREDGIGVVPAALLTA
jgi:predicted AAA+ superfamily ATPase